MKPSYDHTQSGTLMRIVLGTMAAGTLCTCVGLAIARFNPQAVLSLGGVGAMMTVTTFLFHSLNVRLDSECIRLRFGIGLVRKKFKLSEVDEVSPSRSSWFNGWGIKKIRHGWLFNVSGFETVELKMKNGRRYLIGTDEPKKLATAIQEALGTKET